jgi:hypothetical protein
MRVVVTNEEIIKAREAACVAQDLSGARET